MDPGDAIVHVRLLSAMQRNAVLLVLGAVNVAVDVALNLVLREHFGLTGIAAAINLSTVIAGGTAPYTAQWLVQITGDAKAPAWWIIAVALLALIAALTLPGGAFRPGGHGQRHSAYASADPSIDPI